MVDVPYIPDAARRLFSRDLCEMYGVVPVDYDKKTGTMTIACRKGRRFERIAEREVGDIEFVFEVSGRPRIRVVLHSDKRMSEEEMNAVIDRYWPKER